MAKHVPQRSCVVCRTPTDKTNLVRVVKRGEEFFVDRTFKADGRGAYVCKNPECIKKLLKTRAFNRAFKTAVPDEVYAEAVREAENAE